MRVYSGDMLRLGVGLFTFLVVFYLEAVLVNWTVIWRRTVARWTTLSFPRLASLFSIYLARKLRSVDFGNRMLSAVKCCLRHDVSSFLIFNF